MARTLPLLIGLTVAQASPLAADEILLVTGGRLVGDVVRRDGRALVLDVDIGEVTVPLDQIEHINSGPRTPYALYRDRASRLAADDVEGWMSLALWARASGLAEPARRAFARVVAVDPTHAAAHQGLGHVRVGERWMTVADAYRARGYVQYQGRWMTPAERDAKVREEEARAALERARREEREREERDRAVSARLRELEERVKEAEDRTRKAESRAREVEARAAAAERAAHRHHHPRRRSRHGGRLHFHTGQTLTSGVFTVCRGDGPPRFCTPVPLGCTDPDHVGHKH